MNVNWDTTAILTQSVRTHLDLILVNAMMDLLETVSYVKVRSFTHFASAYYFTNRAWQPYPCLLEIPNGIYKFTQSNSDRLFNTQSQIQRADWLMLDNIYVTLPYCIDPPLLFT